MSRPPFAELSERAQVARLRPLATAALARYPITVERLRLLNHGFNTTFRVDTADGQRFALRLNVNSRRTPGNLAAETAWLRALAADTELVVPVPQMADDGEVTELMPFEDLGRPVAATLFSWLPGRDVGDEPTLDQMRAVGRAAATLHEHAAGWSLPPGAELPTIDRPLMDVENRFDADHELLTPDRRTVIDATFAEVQARYDELLLVGGSGSGGGAGPKRQPLHADLHNANLKWHRGHLAVFDFDDSGIGVPIQDLAIAAYYLRDAPEHEAAMHEGYAAVRALPDHTTAQYEAIVASRNLVLLNDVFATTIPEWRAMLPRYLANSIVKLRHYLDTGVYRHDVPGVEPIK